MTTTSLLLRKPHPVRAATLIAAAFLIAFSTAASLAQPPSYPQRPGYGAGTTAPAPSNRPRSPYPRYEDGPRLEDYSYIYTPPTEPKKLAKHDIVFIVVQESAESTSEAEVQRRKNALYDAILENFVVLKDLFTIKPSPQSDGDPRVRGQLTQTYRAENELESREAIQLKIAARIVDVQPNGHVVLEAHKVIRVNNEIFEVSLSGVCDPADVSADRMVKSERIVNLQLNRRNAGHTRDAVKRGWLTRCIDLFDPF